MNMERNGLISDIRQYLEEKRESFLADWLDLIRHVSVSATGEGIEDCCDWIIKKMEKLNIQTEKCPVQPYPVILGRYGNDPKKKTILLYAHYDVKPAGDLSKWKSAPFEPDIRDEKVYARGSADNKSPLMAHLKALEYYQQRKKEVPVNLIYLFEGCEEEGSKGLEEFLRENRQRLGADMLFFSDGPKDPSGLPIIALGAKGNLGIRIHVRTMNRNVHSRYAPVLPSAAWELVDILSKLKSGDHVLIPGFTDGITPFTEKEKEIMKNLPESESVLNRMYDVVPGNYGEEFYPRLLGMPTFNICRIECGANGVVPAEASADLDVRLVPNQKPELIFAKIRDYILSLGYDNVTVTLKGSKEASKTPVDTPFLPVIEEAVKEIYGEYVIYPCRPSSAPDYLWTNVLGLPAIQVRWSDADSDNHAPNEHLSIREYFDGTVLTACVFDAVGNRM